MRPNLFANTPDILHEYLQHGGRPAFIARFVLAATLGAQLRHLQRIRAVENVPVKPGSEEYPGLGEVSGADAAITRSRATSPA